MAVTIYSTYLRLKGPGVAQWLRRCATSRTVPGSIPGGVTGFFSDIFFPTIPWPWIDSFLSENEYQEDLLGIKAAGLWG